MIPHTCTPYCDGQRYCVEPGTHTLDVRTNYILTKDRLNWQFPVIVLRVSRNYEAPLNDRPGYLRDGTPAQQAATDRTHPYAWLVTVKGRERNEEP
jgi:hypothetical protein